MQFAISHDAVPPDRPAEANEPSAAKQRRVATTRNPFGRGGLRDPGEGTPARGRNVIAQCGAGTECRHGAGHDRCAGILQGPDMALYQLALSAPCRQPGAGRASSDRRAGRAGHDRSGNACAQRGKREYRRRRHTANRCDDRSSANRSSANQCNERATGRSGAEPDGHARPGHAVCVSSRRTGHQNLSRHQRLHARR